MSSEYHFGDEVVQRGSHNIGMIKYQGTADRGQPTDAATAMRRSFDVCLIIPLREEFDYARDILRFDNPISDGSYYLHPFSVPGSSVKGIAVVLFEMGPASSAVAATRLLSSYNIRVLALVGIAGALSTKLHLGDVVIASSIDEYLYGAKATPDATGHGVEFELGGVAWQATPEIVSYANNFRYLTDTGAGFTSWRERAKDRRDPGLAAAIPAMADDYPDYLVGAIATGEIVSAAESFARWLRRTNRFRAAIEMEAGGAARAIYRDRRAHLVVVRGVSDFSDERKCDLDATNTLGANIGAWRRYAMNNAVDLFAALVANPQFPWPDSAKTVRSG
jgi:nucleoside phosphorylase